MKIKIQFTVVYFLTLIIVVIGSMFLDHKPQTGEVKGGIFYGTVFITIPGVVLSLIIERILTYINVKYREVARFFIMFGALDLIFLCFSRIELVSSLLELEGEHFKIALPVLSIHLICYFIATLLLFIFRKKKESI